MKIVVIVPTYNEKDSIEKTYHALNKVFQKIKKHDMRVLVVDDTSPDGTADIVRNLIKNNKNIHLKLRKEKKGLGAAYVDAMNYAFNTMNADVIFTFDADLSHDPSVIPQFIEKLEKGASQVIGTRYRKGGGIPKDWGIHRKLLSVLGNLFISVLYLGSGVTDFTGGYKAITKRVYRDIKNSLAAHAGYTFAISSNLETLKKGYKIEEVPFHFRDRTAGKSKMGTDYFINALIFVVKSRIIDFINSRFGRVFVAGGVGGSLQLISYGIIFRPFIESKNIFGLPPELALGPYAFFPQFLLAQFLSIEIGLATSFFVNNHWAFGDKKLAGIKFLIGFLKTNVIASGGILIQVGVAQTLMFIFGDGIILRYVYQIIGILVGLSWNFFFYKKFVWKISK